MLRPLRYELFWVHVANMWPEAVPKRTHPLSFSLPADILLPLPAHLFSRAPASCILPALSPCRRRLLVAPASEVPHSHPSDQSGADSAPLLHGCISGHTQGTPTAVPLSARSLVAGALAGRCSTDLSCMLPSSLRRNTGPCVRSRRWCLSQGARQGDKCHATDKWSRVAGKTAAAGRATHNDESNPGGRERDQIRVAAWLGGCVGPEGTEARNIPRARAGTYLFLSFRQPSPHLTQLQPNTQPSTDNLYPLPLSLSKVDAVDRTYI